MTMKSMWMVHASQIYTRIARSVQNKIFTLQTKCNSNFTYKTTVKNSKECAESANLVKLEKACKLTSASTQIQNQKKTK